MNLKHLFLICVFFAISPAHSKAETSSTLFQCEQYGVNTKSFTQCLSREKACQHLIDNMQLKAVMPWSSASSYVITGDKRAYFYAYPSENCRYNDKFVIPGDHLGFIGYALDTSVDDDNPFILLGYNEASGWIKREQLAAMWQSCNEINETAMASLSTQPYELEKAYLVNQPKLELYMAPNTYCRDKQRYLIKNDRVRVLYKKPYNGFYFISYTHPVTGNHLYGWLSEEGISPQELALTSHAMPAVSPEIVVLDFYDNELKLLDFDYATPIHYQSHFVTQSLLKKISISTSCNYDTPDNSYDTETCDKERECSHGLCNWDGTWIPNDANYFIKAQDDLDSWVANRKAKIISMDNQKAIVDLILGEGKPYSLHLTVELINQKGLWKIDKVDFFDIEEVLSHSE